MVVPGITPLKGSIRNCILFMSVLTLFIIFNSINNIFHNITII